MISSLANTAVSETVLSVAGLTSYLQMLLEQDNALQQVWVIGEVSSATRHRSGLFFTLQDPDASAAINCLVWNNQVHKLAELPVPGEKLIVLGCIRLYAPRGQYQLAVWQSLPAGEGLRALRYRQLRQRLEAEGLFAPQRKRTLPEHPQVVGVVTSPQAAAWGDIQRTLRRRYPGLQVLFSPALVQGERAPASIVTAIHRVEQDGRAQVLIVSRGGGATEDMDCFNDERVVRAIASCPIPIIAGIGHQRDESLADLAADVCVHTPTAAAEQAVPKLSLLYSEHQERTIDLHRATSQQVRSAFEQLRRLRSRLRRLRLDKQLDREIQTNSWRRQQLLRSSQQRMYEAAQHCQLLQQKLSTLDPQAVLKRGYAIVRQADKIVRSADRLNLGETLDIQLGEGKIQVKITEIQATES